MDKFEEVRRSILDLVVENKLILYSTESYLGFYYLFWRQHLEIMFSKLTQHNVAVSYMYGVAIIIVLS